MVEGINNVAFCRIRHVVRRSVILEICFNQRFSSQVEQGGWEGRTQPGYICCYVPYQITQSVVTKTTSDNARQLPRASPAAWFPSPPSPSLPPVVEFIAKWLSYCL